MGSARLPRAQRREQIMVAAASAFVRTGFDATSMDDVARAAGITRLIVYRIFESKYELYAAVLSEVADDIAAAFDPLPLSGTVSAAVLRVARRHPDAFRLLWRHAATEPEFSDFAAVFRASAYNFTEGLLAEQIADPVMRHWTARSVLGYLYEGVCLWLDDGERARDDEVAKALSIGMHAIIGARHVASPVVVPD
ncbi:MAG: TetR/AcrR family transcriptional regulator [Microbacteriaceae bacterium]